jgi:hypothetical protein
MRVKGNDQISGTDASQVELHVVDSRGSVWTAGYTNEGGNVVRDLQSVSGDAQRGVMMMSARSGKAVTIADGDRSADRRPVITTTFSERRGRSSPN